MTDRQPDQDGVWARARAGFAADPVLAGFRDYQLAGMTDLHVGYRPKSRGGLGLRSQVRVLPTGAGKTVEAAGIAYRTHLKGNRSLMLVHTREIFDQTLETVGRVAPGIRIGGVRADLPEPGWNADLYVAMVQTLDRREELLDRLPPPDLLIVDEAHHCRARTWSQIIRRWPTALVLGLTATPVRKDGKGLGEHFERLVVGPSVSSLAAAGWLAPLRVETLPPDSGVGYYKDVGPRGGVVWTMRKTFDAGVEAPLIGDELDALLNLCEGLQTLVFARDIARSRWLVNELTGLGISAEHADGGTPDRLRAEIMARFRSGVTQVVSNANLVSEGFDAPGCEAVVIAQPGTSLTQYLQRAGRAMRPAGGKGEGLLVDLTGIVHVHGPPSKTREWSLEDGWVRETQPPAERHCWGKVTDPATGQVSECGELVRAGAVRCPYCGFVFPKPARPVATEQVDLVDAQGLVFEVDLPWRMRNLEGLAVVSEAMRLPSWAERLEFLQAKLVEYQHVWKVKPGWAWHYLREQRARRNAAAAGGVAGHRMGPGRAAGSGGTGPPPCPGSAVQAETRV